MITLCAPAKLTWTLEIVGRRPDGYHELRSEMVSISLADELLISEGDGLSIIGAGPDVPLGPENLVARALAVVGRRAQVVVTKNIPSGGGLGGGSSDAAAIFRWAGGVSDLTALQLGADVPFCLHGGRALVEGVGERVTPLAFEERQATLVCSNLHVATPAVYRAFDEMWDTGWRPSGTNHLEEPACRVEPRLGELLSWLRERYDDVRLAGSGSALFIPGNVDTQLTSDVTSPVEALRWEKVVTVPAEAERR